MAITQGLCHSWRLDVMKGLHLEAHSYKMALYTIDADLSAETTQYTSEGEVVGSGYDAGGIELTGYNAFLQNGVAVLDFENPIWNPSSIIARGALIYNNSLPGKNAVAVLDFGKNFKSVNGKFEVLLPLPTSTTAIIRIK